MSKKQVTIDIYECDQLDEDGVRCTIEGERQAIKQCALCKKDLCNRHYEALSVTRTGGGGTLLTYFFCSEHSEEFLVTLIKTFGDTRPIPYAGMAK